MFGHITQNGKVIALYNEDGTTISPFLPPKGMLELHIEKAGNALAVLEATQRALEDPKGYSHLYPYAPPITLSSLKRAEAEYKDAERELLNLLRCN